MGRFILLVAISFVLLVATGQTADIKNLTSGQSGERGFVQYDMVGKLGEKEADGRLYASQSSVVLETEGYACMGDDKSRKQTEQVAYMDGKRKATESAVTYIQSETHVKDAMLEKDLLSAYANAQVKVVKEMLKEWYKEAGLGDCYKVKLKVEVIPDEKAMAGSSAKNRDVLENDPSAPLSVKVWTDRPVYSEKENVRIYVKGNKPFYGRLVYRQADGTLIQLLPNPYRKNNYFNGGVIYELPSGDDAYSLETSTPFGIEQVTLYASTAPGGDPELLSAEKVFLVKTSSEDLPITTRGITLKGGKGTANTPAQFAEAHAELKTGKK
jgi:hypothetical protein